MFRTQPAFSTRQSFRHMFSIIIVLALSSSHYVSAESGQPQSAEPVHRVPVIDVTDLYYPYEDPGDNLDLIAAYALPQIDLRAVILDASEAFRKPVADDLILWHDPNGPRDPGIISVSQLNYIFDRNVPFAVGPFTRMKSLDDQMRYVPRYQQQGIELLLKAVAESPEPVDILAFGSLRTIAVAFNRDPGLFRKHVRRIHISGGSSTENFEFGSSADHNKIPGGEWNVGLDPLAFIRIMRSGLPLDWYPCATKDGAFEYGKNNSYWKLPNLSFIQEMTPKLRNYMDFFWSKSTRSDFLRAMDVGIPNTLSTSRYREPHHVWETAIWLSAAHLKLVQRSNLHYAILPSIAVSTGDRIQPNDLLPIQAEVRDDGRVRFRVIQEPSSLHIYYRPDPAANEQALREALPQLYKNFRVP